jgi:hypothetical protein
MLYFFLDLSLRHMQLAFAGALEHAHGMAWRWAKLRQACGAQAFRSGLVLCCGLSMMFSFGIPFWWAFITEEEMGGFNLVYRCREDRDVG